MSDPGYLPYEPDGLGRALAELGEIAAIVAPNTHHHVHVDRWARAAPGAEIHASPDLVRKRDRGDRWRALGPTPAAVWRGVLAQVLIDLGRFTEVVFFHEATRTLIVTDLMQNFEADRVPNAFTRLLLQVGGATGPVGRASIEIRLASYGHREALRDAVRRMVAWQPSSIILSHGRGFRENAVAELQRAFAWAGG